MIPPANIAIVSRGTFNLFLITGLEFSLIYLPISPLFHVKHSKFPDTKLRVFVYSTCRHRHCSTWNIQFFLIPGLEFSFISPADIAIVPRVTFNLFLITGLEFSLTFTCRHRHCSTWNIQFFPISGLEFSLISPADIHCSTWNIQFISDNRLRVFVDFTCRHRIVTWNIQFFS